MDLKVKKKKGKAALLGYQKKSQTLALARIDSHAFQEKSNRMTIVLTKEIDDAEPDYVCIDVAEIAKMDREEAQRAYKMLHRAVKPTFSGNCDHRLNLLDIRRVV